MDQNAEEVVRSAHERVKRDYFSLDLDEFLSKDLERRRICTDRLCGCYNGDTVEKQLKDTLKKYSLFFKSKFPHTGRGTIGKLFESASIRERWADRTVVMMCSNSFACVQILDCPDRTQICLDSCRKFDNMNASYSSDHKYCPKVFKVSSEDNERYSFHPVYEFMEPKASVEIDIHRKSSPIGLTRFKIQTSPAAKPNEAEAKNAFIPRNVAFEVKLYARTMETQVISEIVGIPTEERGVNRAVRAEDLKQFVNGYCTIFEKIFFDDANRKEKGPDGHERRCIACYKWLQLEFGTLRTDTIKKVIRGIKNHNILAAALLCFALQNKFTDHPGFKPVRKKIRVTDDTWMLFKKCLGKEHARDRARELRDFILDTSIAKPISEKYKEIISELRQGFPKFFLDDGSFDKLVFDQADYGELQDCDKCHGDYAAQFLTTCQKPDGISQHKFCRNCMRESAMTIEQAFPEVGEKFKMKLECIKDGCNNEIRIDEVSFLYFPRYARTRLHSASLEGMLLQMGHVRT